jgi:hypothetical protein
MFKNLNFSKLLLWALTPYFAFNSEGQLSNTYKFLASFLQPLQPIFDQYYSDRITFILLAQCKFTRQLQNVLNILYAPSHIADPTNGGIYFSRPSYVINAANSFYQTDAIMYAGAFDDTVQTPVMLESYTDSLGRSQLVIFVLDTIWATFGTQIKAQVAMVSIAGINYSFQTYTI